MSYDGRSLYLPPPASTNAEPAASSWPRSILSATPPLASSSSSFQSSSAVRHTQQRMQHSFLPPPPPPPAPPPPPPASYIGPALAAIASAASAATAARSSMTSTQSTSSSSVVPPPSLPSITAPKPSTSPTSSASIPTSSIIASSTTAAGPLQPPPLPPPPPPVSLPSSSSLLSKSSSQHHRASNSYQTPSSSMAVHPSISSSSTSPLSERPPHEFPFDTCDEPQALPAASPATTATSATTSQLLPSPAKRRRENLWDDKDGMKNRHLENLERPVRFLTMCRSDKEAGMLPSDIIPLYTALRHAADAKGILPGALRRQQTFNGETVSEDMFKSEPGEDMAKIMEVYRRALALVEKSSEILAVDRSEAAWNAMLHYPALHLFLLTCPSVDIEQVDSASTADTFRPLWRRVAGSLGNEPVRWPDSTSPANPKMINYALVLRPEIGLRSLIGKLLSTQNPVSDHNTINHTTYAPLRRLPAPVCIETKTVKVDLETCNVGLGLWIAGYHHRLRSLLKRRPGASAPKIITTPVIRWHLNKVGIYFAIDTGTGIDVMDTTLRFDTSSMVGLYKLRAIMVNIAKWMTDTFQPWMIAQLSTII